MTYKHKNAIHSVERDDSRLGPTTDAPRKRFLLEAMKLPSCRLNFFNRRYVTWSKFSRFSSRRAAEQALAKHARIHGGELHFRVREVL